MSVSLFCYQALAGDRNSLAIPGAKAIADWLSARFACAPTCVGEPQSPLSADWQTELQHAQRSLAELQSRLDAAFERGSRPLSAISRCATALATLPVVARHRPDACIVWFDAHADLNTPAATLTGYLGGMALSGPAGLWDSGLGKGLPLGSIVLVGQRDLDPFEEGLIRGHQLPLIRPGSDIATALSAAVAGRPVYVHVDCDVLEPGILPTEYVVGGGLTLDDLHTASEVLAQNELIGFEIGEFQNAWHATGEPVSPADLLQAFEPIFARLAAETR